MTSKPKKFPSAIKPTRAENYSEWYQQVIRGAELAEAAPVRGCMVLKPWGCALWERVQQSLDHRIKAAGHKNAYFPLLIPLSLIEKEAAHVEGFAKECAVVTHHRLKSTPSGKLVPDAPLEEPLVVRPTSETLVGEIFSRWIQSYRDLPLKINQWANVVRWEMRTRLFLRTSEFLWQEGHSAHADASEALAEAMASARLYERFFSEVLAISVFAGEKTPGERFPGAERTFTLEAMMQDGKALQMGTAHYLGQNFARAANITFNAPNGQPELAYTTSWGASTRMIGGLIMTHSDDDGLVLPPAIAPVHLVLLPMLHKPEHKEAISAYCRALKEQLEEQRLGGRCLDVEIDMREERGGDKLWSWIRKGVPLWIEVGPQEVETNLLSIGRRDRPRGEKARIMRKALEGQVLMLLQELQNELFARSCAFNRDNVQEVHSEAQLREYFSKFTEGSAPGFALCHFCGDSKIEAQLAEQLKCTIRCLPFSEEHRAGTCIFTGKSSPQRILLARAY